MWDDQSLQSRRPSSAGVSTHHTFDLLSEAEGQMLPVLTDEEVSAFFSYPDFPGPEVRRRSERPAHPCIRPGGPW